MRFLTSCLMALLIVLGPAQAEANMGRRWWGDLAAEPSGVQEVTIEHEELTLDLRPLATLEPARVTAIYHLHNPRRARHLELYFISGAPGIADFEVRLGDKLIPSQPMATEDFARHREQLPKDWEPHQYVRGIDQQTHILYDHFELRPIRFSLDLPAGESTLAARYRARACGADEGSPTASWVFPYVLAPAKQWRAFGRLDVAVYLPEGWESASRPDLVREGNTLTGTFKGLPADSLQVVTRSPVTVDFRRAMHHSAALGALALLAGGPGCWLAGRWLGKRLSPWLARSDWRGWTASTGLTLSAALLAFLWAWLVGAACYLPVAESLHQVDGQQSPFFHEKMILPRLGAVLAFALVLCGGFALAFGVAWRASVRKAAQGEPGGAQSPGPRN